MNVEKVFRLLFDLIEDQKQEEDVKIDFTLRKREDTEDKKNRVKTA